MYLILLNCSELFKVNPDGDLAPPGMLRLLRIMALSPNSSPVNLPSIQRIHSEYYPHLTKEKKANNYSLFSKFLNDPGNLQDLFEKMGRGMFCLHENAREKIIKLLFNPAVNHQQARATLGMRRYYECKFTKEGIVEKGKAQISVIVKNLAAESNNTVTTPSIQSISR